MHLFCRFEMAFNSVDNKLLLLQLLHMEPMVISSYLVNNQVKSFVSGNDIFLCNRGVRQGCLLSPVLFALHLNDSNRHIKASSQGVMIDNIPVHSLSNTDYRVLISFDRKDLQLQQLDALERFSKSLKMEMNMDKMRGMIIPKQKSPAKSKENKTWKIADKELKECNSYRYLGVMLKSNGSYSEHIDKIKVKAQKTFSPSFLKAKMGMVSIHVFFYIYSIVRLSQS